MLQRLGAVARAKPAVLFCAALAVSGCNAIRYANDHIKVPLDEFVIRTFSPRTAPRDANLRPSLAGSPSRNDVTAAELGKSIVFPQSAEARTASAPTQRYSEGEALLLRRANIDVPSPEITGAILANVVRPKWGPPPLLRRSFDR